MVKPNSVLSITLLGVGNNKPQGHWFVDGTVDYPFSLFFYIYYIKLFNCLSNNFYNKIGREVPLTLWLNRAYETP